MSLHSKLRYLKYYILHRWVWRSHLYPLRTSKKGEYYDIDEKMRFALFSMIIDYVENELAHLAKIADISELATVSDKVSDTVAWKYKNSSLWHRWKNRDMWNEALGREYLEWEIQLGEKSPFQSANAKEILELYNIVKAFRYSDEKWAQEYANVTDLLVRIVRVRGAMWT